MKGLFFLLVVTTLFSQFFSPALFPENCSHHDRTHRPIVAYESLNFENCEILKQFEIEQHIPEADRKAHPEYFVNRDRIVYLTSDKQYAVKVWSDAHPAATNFMKAFQSHFYDDIAQIEGVIFDKNNRCRGYITSYIISREREKQKWESYGFVLEKNCNDVKIFAACDKQPQNYKNFFEKLMQNSKKSGFLSTDFCPNNIGIDHKTGRLYLFDLEDVLLLESISRNDSQTQMLLEYNPKDYLEHFNLLQ